MPQRSDFRIVEVDVPSPGQGQVQVQNLCMSVDPYMRGRMIDQRSYTPPFKLGETLTGGAIGRVVASNHPGFAPGDHVESFFGWREAFTAAGEQVQKLGELIAPASAYLGVLGMPGRTAYFGLLDVGALKDGETVFVSGAAGAVGAVVGQIAKLKGARVLGSAGSANKVRYLTTELGFDYAFDYHDGAILDHLREGAPKGLDVYFDNVGGEHLQAALSHMRQFGRIPLCGAISQYNATSPVPGPNNLVMAIGLGLTLRGFIVSHFDAKRAQFDRDMSQWVTNGRVKGPETIVRGIDRAPDAFIGLFTGDNVGKMVVQVEPSASRDSAHGESSASRDRA
jgi:NADPH-dependent curcumin reductase CurA